MVAHFSVVRGSGERRRNRGTSPPHLPPLGINFGKQRMPLRSSALGAMTALAWRHPTGRTRSTAAGTPPQPMPEVEGLAPVSIQKYFRPF